MYLSIFGESMRKACDAGAQEHTATDISYSIKKTDAKQGIGLLAAEGVEPPMLRCFFECQKAECFIKHGQFTFL